MRPEVSIVVAAHERPADLEACLEGIERLDATPGTFEVVVVDDGSGPAVRQVAEQAGDRGLPVRYERLDGRGLQAARDHGAACARGELLAYLDDDAVVEPGWLGALLESRRRFAWAGAAGRIRLAFPAQPPRWMTPALRHGLSELELGDESRLLAPHESPYGANCAVTRAAYEAVGGFRAGLDRSGTSLLSNGEVDFFRRVREHGPLAWVPDAAVAHRVAPDRLTVAYARRRAMAQGVSDERMNPTRGLPARLARAARELVRAAQGALLAVRGSLRGEGPVTGLAVVEYSRGRLLALRKRDVGV